MSQGKLSTDAFRARLGDQVKQVCIEHRWNFDNNVHRGWAFQFWVADLFGRREGIETSAEETIFLNNDCGIDIILEDQNQKRFYLIQAKFLNTPRPSKRPMSANCVKGIPCSWTGAGSRSM